MAKNRLDRYEGAMLGVAVGDALGAPLEFMDAGAIRSRHGIVREMIGGGWLHVEPGEVTDDTQMTLAVAEGIASGADSVEREIGLNFLRWYRTHPKDIGGTCNSVISMMTMRPSNLSDWLKVSELVDKQTNGWTAGNGALMRTIYPALYYQQDKAKEAAANIARMTHWHKDSTKAVLQYTDAVNAIANSGWTAEEATARAEAIMSDFMYGPDCGNPQPTGYSVASLMCAMNAIRDTDSFENALVYAVNLGGDADTIGAITGGLAGAIYGASEIPLRWINALGNKPNRKTVRLFHRGTGTSTEGEANTLAIRLLDLAYIAYQHHGHTK